MAQKRSSLSEKAADAQHTTRDGSEPGVEQSFIVAAESHGDWFAHPDIDQTAIEVEWV
jgi:hypothetical protein